ncbi:MAG: phage portal protein, partial [Lachnospiraceae bacterium]
YVEEVKNLIFVLKGYGGSSVAEFMQGLNEDRAVVVDSDEDSGVSVLNPQMDITALQGHYEQLKRDLIEDGQSVNKDLDKFGSAPSGVALKFMYSGLDLKCNLLETEFKMSFEMLLYFVDEYLKLIGKGDFTQRDMEIVFNRDMAVNETEIIQNCINSRGIISDETIIARHPFTTDVEEELAKLEEQKKNKEPKWDKTPLPLGGGTNAKEQ